MAREAARGWSRTSLPARRARTSASFTEVKGKVFFTVGSELWKSDGTARGTVRLFTFGDDSRFAPSNLFEYRGKLVFLGFDHEHGYETWVSDGTPRGTRLLLDYNPGPTGIGITNRGFAELDGDLVFKVFDATTDTLKLVKLEDWKRVVELADLGLEASIVQTLVVGHRLFILYEDEGDSFVAVTMGRPGSLQRLVAPRNGKVSRLVELGGEVYFQVSSELWVTNGTEPGTRRVKDMLPRPGRSRATAVPHGVG